MPILVINITNALFSLCLSTLCRLLKKLQKLVFRNTDCSSSVNASELFPVEVNGPSCSV